MLLGALGFSGYGFYKAYNAPSMVKKREKLLAIFGTIISMAEAVSDTAEALGVISKDFKDFVKSDSDQIPNSLKQVSKFTRSEEFSDPVIKITRALTIGILRGYRSEAEREEPFGEKISFQDKVLDKLFSTSGSGFASVIVGSFAKNLVMGYYSEEALNGRSNWKSPRNFDSDDDNDEYDSPPKWVNAICSEKGRELVAECVELLVRTGVSVYLDKTMHINTYNEVFAGLTNPRHERKMRDILSTVCNGAVETLIKTSNEVLRNPDYGSSSNTGQSFVSIDELVGSRQGSRSDRTKTRKSMLSTSLSVPGHRKLVLDVTGRVTFETVRSFLEFLLDKMSENLRRSVGVVHEAVVERGIEAVRFLREQSSAFVTLCLTLCFHILGSVWILVPNYDC